MSAAWVMLNVRNVPKVVTRLGRAASHAAVGPERTTLPADAAAIFRKDESVGLRIETDDGSFHSPSCTIEAARGTPIEVTWINELKDENRHYLPHLLPIDPTLHWANPPGPRDMRPMFARTPG